MALRIALTAGCALALTVSGCSLLVSDDFIHQPNDGGNADGGDGGDGGALNIDAALDAMVDSSLPDANSANLSITAFSTAGMQPLEEGATAVVVFTGMSITDRVAVTTGDPGVRVDMSMVNNAGTKVAVVVTIMVDMTKNDGATRNAEFRFNQPGGTQQTLMVPVVARDEFVGTAGDMDITTLKARYSSATFNALTRLRGSGAARIVTNGDIVVSQTLSADGVGRDPGAGGCGGGGQGQAGGCSTGGGVAGSAGPTLGRGEGGGGGGNLGRGGDGTGSATGGDGTGTEFITKLGSNLATDSRGNGGGGGGAGGAGGAGGEGGGGGGTIELSAGGVLRIGMPIHANGGEGTSGGGLLNCATAGGSGGGGSGGVILLRAGTMITAGGTVTANGGPAGAASGACNRGGMGASGRIRIDAPVAVLPGMLGSASGLKRGPMWATGTPLFVRSTTPTFGITGGSNTQYGVVVNNMGNPIPVTGDIAGNTSVQLTLRPEEFNTICALVPMGVFTDAEAKNCRTVYVLLP